ncbi:MAG: hypothetical protein ACRD12_01895 [Acidimicrobiales bacterium]
MTLRVALSVAEIVLFVAAVAYFLIRLTKILTHIGDTLEKIGEGVVAIEGHTRILGPGTDEINARLRATAGNLEQAAIAAEALAR